MITRLPARCAAFYSAALLNNRMKSLESRQARPGGRRVDPNVILPTLERFTASLGGGVGGQEALIIFWIAYAFLLLCAAPLDIRIQSLGSRQTAYGGRRVDPNPTFLHL